mgnify:CR=1 FL=1
MYLAVSTPHVSAPWNCGDPVARIRDRQDRGYPIAMELVLIFYNQSVSSKDNAEGKE